MISEVTLILFPYSLSFLRIVFECAAGQSSLEYPCGTFENLLVSTNDRHFPRRYQAEHLRDVEHSKRVQDRRGATRTAAVGAVRRRWLDGYDVVKQGFEDCRAGRQHSCRTLSSDPKILSGRFEVEFANGCDDIKDPAAIRRPAQ